MTNLQDKKAAILGWGVDTKDVVPWLLSQGAKITVFDQKDNFEDQKEFPKLIWQLGSNDFGDLSKFDLIIRAPGIYRFRKEIIDAEKKGVEISSKTKLFFDLCPAKIIGVTGTKGKGTTATLIYKILKNGGKDAYLGGNIGTSIFDLLPKLGNDSRIILELSSFQLIDLHKSPHIAVVLMVTSEHLDWHPTLQEYVDAKKSIVSYQTEQDFAVINDDYPNSKKIGDGSKGQKLYFSRTHEVTYGCFLMQKRLINRLIDSKDIIIDQDEIRLRGEHNLENVMAAALTTQMEGISLESIREVIRNFKGLEHRLEEVANINGVTFINDSFSTTPETTIAAIKSFKEPIILIAGGSEKGSDFRQLGKEIVQSGNVKAVILIGLMSARIREAIIKAGGQSIEIVAGAKDMKQIMSIANEKTSRGDVVILSPACASFDMFLNYKDRGNQFKTEVLKLGKSGQK